VRERERERNLLAQERKRERRSEKKEIDR